MFIIDTRSKYPIFEQLKRQVLEFITIGILSPKDKLPSVRAVAFELGIHPNTVAKTYHELEALGYVHTEQGKGYFIVNQPSDENMKEVKLHEFRKVVITMKKYKIPNRKLQNIVQEVYMEEKRNA